MMEYLGSLLNPMPSRTENDLAIYAKYCTADSKKGELVWAYEWRGVRGVSAKRMILDESCDIHDQQHNYLLVESGRGFPSRQSNLADRPRLFDEYTQERKYVFLVGNPHHTTCHVFLIYIYIYISEYSLVDINRRGSPPARPCAINFGKCFDHAAIPNQVGLTLGNEAEQEQIFGNFFVICAGQMRHVFDQRYLQVGVQSRYHAPVEDAQFAVGGSQEVARVRVAVLRSKRVYSKSL